MAGIGRNPIAPLSVLWQAAQSAVTGIAMPPMLIVIVGDGCGDADGLAGTACPTNPARCI